MSWILGFSGKLETKLKDKILSLSPNPIFQIEEENLFLLAGGNRKTCFHLKDEVIDIQTLTVGIGIRQFDKLRFLNEKDWFELSERELLENCNGHFVHLRWNTQHINIYTDMLGIRELFIYKISDGILFSTRQDWIAILSRAELNFSEFGSRWLLYNQISSNSVFYGIERITAGTTVIIDRKINSFELIKNYWLPKKNNEIFIELEFNKMLYEIATFPLNSGEKISLSLSGGMDSRVILSLLFNTFKGSWDTHTFGSQNHIDSIVVSQIVSYLKIAHKQINLDFPSIDILIKELDEYGGQTIVSNPASAIIQLRNYNELSQKDIIIIDGGFGEIWRREFLNRLLVLGHKALENNRNDVILSHLKLNRGDIFNPDIQKKMKEGSLVQIENIFQELPKIKDIGIENWLDIFAIKTRLINVYSQEQSRLDSLGICYMPFIQPVLLNNLLCMPVKMKKNGRLMRKVIKLQCEQLEKFPLAKGNFSHPYFLNTIQTRIWGMLHRKFYSNQNNNPLASMFITYIKPYILDILSSGNVRECAFYNYSKLEYFSDRLNKNQLNGNDINELDWWLSFEQFRKKFSSFL